MSLCSAGSFVLILNFPAIDVSFTWPGLNFDRTSFLKVEKSSSLPVTTIGGGSLVVGGGGEVAG